MHSDKKVEGISEFFFMGLHWKCPVKSVKHRWWGNYLYTGQGLPGWMYDSYKEFQQGNSLPKNITLHATAIYRYSLKLSKTMFNRLGCWSLVLTLLSCLSHKYVIHYGHSTARFLWEKLGWLPTFFGLVLKSHGLTPYYRPYQQSMKEPPFICF